MWMRPLPLPPPPLPQDAVRCHYYQGVVEASSDGSGSDSEEARVACPTFLASVASQLAVNSSAAGSTPAATEIGLHLESLRERLRRSKFSHSTAAATEQREKDACLRSHLMSTIKIESEAEEDDAGTPTTLLEKRALAGYASLESRRLRALGRIC